MSVDRVTTLSEVQLTEQDLHRIFAVTPHPYLVLAPSLVIVGANDAYLRQTLTNRSDIVGCHMFEVFPDNPDVLESHGVRLLQASLGAVFDLRLPHRMAQQRYDVRGGDGRFVERHWKPVNYPVLDDHKRVSYLLHHVPERGAAGASSRYFDETPNFSRRAISRLGPPSSFNASA